jgi:uncharacterized membrane protein YjjP (DUF1212 family)
MDTPTPAAPAETHADLLLALAEGLQRVGTPPGLVEDMLSEVSASLGIKGRFFALPTAVLASLRVDGQELTRLVPAPTGDQDLAQLEALRRLTRELVRGSVGADEALARLEALASASPPFGPVVSLLSYGWVSAMAAFLFGGGPTEAAVAGLSGVLVGALHLRSAAWGLGGLLEAASAATAALVATAAATRVAFAPDLAVLASLIVLVPGFIIHRGLTDLSTGHLISGSARMAQAGTVLLLMGFGVAFGGRVAMALAGTPELVVPAAVPPWAPVAALAGMTPSLQVIFRAPRRSWPWMLCAMGIAWAGARLGTGFGSEVGAFFGAFALGVYARVWERVLDRPAALPLAPGLMVLVPGAVGFRGVAALLAGDAMKAVQTGFSALMVATALVTGLLAANLLLRRPPSR